MLEAYNLLRSLQRSHFALVLDFKVPRFNFKPPSLPYFVAETSKTETHVFVCTHIHIYTQMEKIQ